MATRSDLDACSDDSTEELVIAEENGKQFRVINPASQPVRRIRIDGCVFDASDGKKCDFVFEMTEENHACAFYVELKGTDLNGAYRQLVATLDKLFDVHRDVNRKCFIVSVETPRLTTAGQRLRKRMKTNRGVLLTIQKTPLCVDRKGNVATGT